MKTNQIGYTVGVWLEGKPLILNKNYALKKTEAYPEDKAIRCGQYTMKDNVEVTIDLWRSETMKMIDIWVETMDLPGKAREDYLEYLMSNSLMIDREVYPTVEVMEHSGRYIAQLVIDTTK